MINKEELYNKLFKENINIIENETLDGIDMRFIEDFENKFKLEKSEYKDYDLVFKNCNIIKCDISSISFFYNTLFIDCVIDECNIEYSDFNGNEYSNFSTFKKVIFNKNIMRNSRLSSKIEDSVFKNNDMRCTDLRRSMISNTIIEECDLRGAKFDNYPSIRKKCKFVNTTIFDYQTKYFKKYTENEFIIDNCSIKNA